MAESLILALESMPTIEEFNRALRRLSSDISQRFRRWRNTQQADSTYRLCSRCVDVGAAIKDTIEAYQIDPNPGNAVGRDGAGNIYLGTLEEIVAQGDCALCSLLARQFLRSKRCDIYSKIQEGDLPWEKLSLDLVVESLVSLDESSPEFLDEPFATNVQISVGTLAVDGTLSVWWPEYMTDEDNDEPIQIPMIAEDHETLFGKPKSWVRLPRAIKTRGRDMVMIRKCFDICKTQHTSCVPKLIGARPKRLIDVEDGCLINVPTSQTLKYVALSYMWGRSPFLTLNMANQDDLKQKNALLPNSNSIPGTISDAMLITRQFGFRYLWVDALCIMQDNYTDKMEEIGVMHWIYAAADLTIVASTGHDSSARILDMDPDITDDIELLAGYRFTLEAPEMRDVTEFSTWFTRGWTLQELIFSRRLLYFTPTATYFNCNIGNWSEDYPLDTSIDAKDFHYSRDEDPKDGFDFTDTLSPFENYSSMVQAMSIRQLTNTSDVLNACQGFHFGMLQQHMGESISGLPASCFDYALAWHPAGNLTRRSPAESGLRFPSWSWAGWIGPIQYPFLSGPKEVGVSSLVEWTSYSSVQKHALAEQVLICKGPPYCNPHWEERLGNISKWATPLLRLKTNSKWNNLRVISPEEAEDDGYTTHPTGLATEFGLLVFRTNSANFTLRSAKVPDLQKRRELRCFHIMANESLVGEINVDSSTLELSNIDTPLIEVELIALFKIDFDSSSMKSVLWRNTYSMVKIFTPEFVDMVSKLSDKTLYAVMWIRWEDGIAYRIAVGYVSSSGFRAAELVEKQIVLG